MEKIKKDKTKKHHDRPDLVGEHSLGDLGQIILLLIFLAVWITDSFFFKYSTYIADYIPIYVKILISAAILFCSGFLARAGLKIIFGEIREKPMVIRKGVFGIVRHPIYLGSILLYLGLIVLTLSIISAIIWIFIVIFYYYISKYEEKILLKEFGSEYEQYMNDVPMLIPRFF
ncbi:MAG: isoprenylcysteine carboxylmethyltransferase family protein [Bacteroidales bacterium]|nr:isoprenylcysteine carboxylmethyltransferase family protein [Bacteroidales bacterium]